MSTSPPESLSRRSTLVGTLRSTAGKALTLRSYGGRKAQGPTRYRAFISYSHRDTAVARWLHRAIETFHVPRSLVGQVTECGPVPKRLSPIFRDEDELPGAAELGPKLQDALANSDALIVLCSPAAAASVWCNREIRLFKTINPDRPVLAVIVDGVPGSADRECFPEALHLSLGTDGLLVPDPDAEPLAPDLQKQDRQIVRLKTIAGLLGVSYNDLFRRDRRRARRRAAFAGALVFLVVTALSVLSIVAFSYARLAIHEASVARRAERLAEANAKAAEDRAWLAQQAAFTVRTQADMLQKDCKPNAK